MDRWLDIYAYGPQPPYRPWSVFHAKRLHDDACRFKGILSEFKPNVVNWWSMNGLAMNLLPLPNTFHIPDIHWIEHPWMVDEYGVAGERGAAFRPEKFNQRLGQLAAEEFGVRHAVPSPLAGGPGTHSHRLNRP